jgi:hypothetical protein
LLPRMDCIAQSVGCCLEWIASHSQSVAASNGLHRTVTLFSPALPEQFEGMSTPHDRSKKVRLQASYPSMHHTRCARNIIEGVDCLQVQSALKA